MLSACSSSSKADDDDGPEGPATTTTVTIKPSPGLVDLVAFRDYGDPTWHSASQDADGSYTIAVHGTYWVSVVCHQDTTHWINQIGRTLSDPTEIDDALCLDSSSVHVTGGLGGPGRVLLGETAATAVQGAFELYSPAGTYDFYASRADRVRILRDVTVTTTTPIPDLEMDTKGTALIPTPLIVTNAAQGSAYTVEGNAVIHRRKHPTAPLIYYAGPPANAALIPPGADLLAGDELAMIGATEYHKLDNHTATRAIRRLYKPGDSTDIALPAPLQQLNWTLSKVPLSVSWTALPENMSFKFVVRGYAGDTSGYRQTAHVIQFSASFLKETGASNLQIENTMPGFDRSWELDPVGIETIDTYGQTEGDPATEPVITVSDEWLLAIIG